jgi:hypothetical protein
MPFTFNDGVRLAAKPIINLPIEQITTAPGLSHEEIEKLRQGALAERTLPYFILFNLPSIS